MSRYIWLEIVKGEVSVRINKNDYNDYSCTCGDKRHLYFNKYPDFKCKAYKIAIKKLNASGELAKKMIL